MAIGLIGAVVQGIGTFMQMSAQAEAAKYNQKIDERNARVVRQQTQLDVEDKRRENQRVLASMRSTYSQNGLTMAGTPMDVFSDTILEQEYDVQKLKIAGLQKAEGYKESAALHGMEADAASTAGMIGLATGVLSGIGNMTSSGSSIFA